MSSTSFWWHDLFGTCRQITMCYMPPIHASTKYSIIHSWSRICALSVHSTSSSLGSRHKLHRMSSRFLCKWRNRTDRQVAILAACDSHSSKQYYQHTLYFLLDIFVAGGNGINLFTLHMSQHLVFWSNTQYFATSMCYESNDAISPMISNAIIFHVPDARRNLPLAAHWMSIDVVQDDLCQQILATGMFEKRSSSHSCLYLMVWHLQRGIVAAR